MVKLTQVQCWFLILTVLVQKPERSNKYRNSNLSSDSRRKTLELRTFSWNAPKIRAKENTVWELLVLIFLSFC